MHLRVNAESLHVGFGWYTSWGWAEAAVPVNGSLVAVGFVDDNGCCDVDLEDNTESFSWFWLLLVRILWLFSFNESFESPPRRRRGTELLIDCNKQSGGYALWLCSSSTWSTLHSMVDPWTCWTGDVCGWKTHKLMLTRNGMLSLPARIKHLWTAFSGTPTFRGDSMEDLGQEVHNVTCFWNTSFLSDQQ